MKKQSKVKQIVIIVSIILGVLVIGAGGYVYYVYHSIQKTAAQVYKPINIPQINHASASPLKSISTLSSSKSSKPINILLLGVDERPSDIGRSDTLMVVTLNPSTHSMLMTSIPRDTRVQLPTNYKNYNSSLDKQYATTGYSKINAAYAYGNEGLAVLTAEKYLNININYYVKVNMQGLSALVDAVGGISVNNPLDWYDEGYYKKGYHYKKGPIDLNGPQALGFVRMRHLDPRGDFGRNQRERLVVQAIINKGKSLTGVTNMQAILNAIGSNVSTNLTFNDMKKMVTTYKQCRQNITSYEVKGTPKYIGGVSWVIVTPSEFQHAHNLINKEMN